jgi:hypothetical protein
LHVDIETVFSAFLCFLSFSQKRKEVALPGRLPGAVHRMTAAQSKAVGHNTNPKDSNVPPAATCITAPAPAPAAQGKAVGHDPQPELSISPSRVRRKKSWFPLGG